ncbi:hypothetical protein [Succinivibrio sp.]|uniref:hypothetical protein n=1 Tax=Succinivibrio sp. TaxID=2053619 RepID=UPI0025F024D5|nr:hypothetical protein [Succinivibrio sp.]MBQ9220426.1 hypothetical protein [Succinivibrio sp.]
MFINSIKKYYRSNELKSDLLLILLFYVGCSFPVLGCAAVILICLLIIKDYLLSHD